MTKNSFFNNASDKDDPYIATRFVSLAQYTYNCSEIETAVKAKGIDVNAKANLSFSNDTQLDDATALHLATAKGNTKVMELLFELNANPNATTGNGFSALDLAVMNKQTDAVKILVAKGVVFNESSKVTANDLASIHPKITEKEFLNAAKKGDALTVRLAVLQGINVLATTSMTLSDNFIENEYFEENLTIFHIAAANDDIKVLKAGTSGKLNGLEAQTKTGRTPLYFAVAFNKRKSIAWLMRIGSNPFILDKNKLTPYGGAGYLDYEFACKGENSLKSLIRTNMKYSQLQYINSIKNIDQSSKKKNSSNNVSLFTHKLTAKEFIALVEDVNNYDAIEQGIKQNKICDINATADITTKNNLKMRDATALHQAVVNGNLKIAELLIENDADINAQTKKGYTPIFAAILCKQKYAAELLAKKGADLDVTDNKGTTPLEKARDFDLTHTIKGINSYAAEFAKAKMW